MSAAAYRNSQLRLLRSCRFAYSQAYLQGVPGAPSPALQAGTNVHAAIQLAVREIVKGGAFLDVHQLAYRAVQGGQVEYSDAIEVLTTFTESLAEEGGLEIDPRAVFLIEERLEVPLTLWDGTEAVFFGTPDLVERTGKTSCRITDWKTHRHPETEEEFRADAQLKRYALLVAHEFPAFQRFELVKRFVRFRNRAYRMTLTREDLEPVRIALVSEIQAAREIEAAGEFTATGGDWCGLCAHHHTCPLVQTYREAGEDLLSIPDDERASEIAGAAIALDAAASRLKGRLKTYLGDTHRTGTVPVSGGEYGYGPTTSREISPEQLEGVFAAAGAELPPEVLSVDLTALDRLKKRLPETLVSAIDRVTHITESSQCRFRRASSKKKAPAAASASPAAPAIAGGEDLF